MKSAVRWVRRFIREEHGTETVEWAIMAGLIVVGTITAVAAIGTWVSGKFTTLSTDLSTH